MIDVPAITVGRSGTGLDHPRLSFTLSIFLTAHPWLAVDMHAVERESLRLVRGCNSSQECYQSIRFMRLVAKHLASKFDVQCLSPPNRPPSPSSNESFFQEHSSFLLLPPRLSITELMLRSCLRSAVSVDRRSFMLPCLSGQLFSMALYLDLVRFLASLFWSPCHSFVSDSLSCHLSSGGSSIQKHYLVCPYRSFSLPQHQIPSHAVLQYSPSHRGFPWSSHRCSPQCPSRYSCGYCHHGKQYRERYQAGERLHSKYWPSPTVPGQ